MPLFRRRRAEAEETATDPSAAGRRTGRRPKAVEPGASAPPVGPGAEPGGPPPPLPVPAAAPASGVELRSDYSECFVCGSTLQGKTCPKCRMTWVE